jgi:hypothetical protein
LALSYNCANSEADGVSPPNRTHIAPADAIAYQEKVLHNGQAGPERVITAISVGLQDKRAKGTFPKLGNF